MNADDPVESYDAHFAEMPIIAILRGIKPDEAVAIGEALVEAGVRILEVPLNSPEPFDSIERLVQAVGGRASVGAGTVLSVEDVDRVEQAGGRIVVSPNCDVAVIQRTREHGLVSLPGCLTPTEAFAALKAGAHAVKLFPGELVGPPVAKAMAAVLPKSTRLIIVGGVSADTVGHWRGAPVHGFGIGSSLYKPGRSAAEVGEQARAFVQAVRDWSGARG